MWYPVLLMTIILMCFAAALPVVKGYFGEIIVRFVLRFLDRNKYRTFNNVYFPAYNGLFMQIDHLVVCQGCIIVIETKNYNGVIEGDWRSKYWSIKRKGFTGKAYNPMRQNSYHIRMLRENKIFPDFFRVYPVVCLGLFARPEINGKMPVVTPQRLPACIREIVGENKYAGDFLELSSRVEKLMINDRGIGREHIKRLNDKKLRKKKGLCPRCGGRLYYKNSMRGRVAICTNYPWCSYRNQIQSKKSK